MVGSLMVIDLVSPRQIAGFFSIYMTLLLVFLVIGASGPEVQHIDNTYSNCPNTGHHCTRPYSGEAVLMGTGEIMTIYAMGVESVNRYFYVAVAPYEFPGRTDSPVNSKLYVETSLYGSDHASLSSWHQIYDKVVKEIDLSCPNNQINDENDSNKCKSFNIVEVFELEYKNYQAEIKFLPDRSNITWMGDVQFSVYTQASSFSDFIISFIIVFFGISIALFIAFIWRLRYEGRIAQWLWEQRAAALLLIGAICLTNPFSLIAEYAVNGWFINVLGATLESVYIFFLLLFWLLSVDKIRKDELREEFKHFYLPKVALVGTYCFLQIVYLVYFRTTLKNNPIRGEEENMTGFIIFDLVLLILLLVIIGWLLYLIYKTYMVVKADNTLMRRYLFVGLPTLLMLATTFIVVSSGGLRGHGSALSFLVALWIEVSYVWFLVVGYWPTHSGDEFLGRGQSRGGDVITFGKSFAGPATYPEETY